MRTQSKYLILKLILISGMVNYSCSKENVIELETNYLTVTDVLEYCSVECGENTDLRGEPVKMKGYLKTNDQGNFLYNFSSGQLVFVLFDIRNSKSITIEILKDSLQIEQKLKILSMDMIYLNSVIKYGYIPSSESGCSNSLYLEIDEIGDIKKD